MDRFFEYVRRFFSSIPGKGFSSAILLLSTFFAIFSAAPTLSAYIGRSRVQGLYALLIGAVVTSLIGGIYAGMFYVVTIAVGTIVMGELIRANVSFGRIMVYSGLITVGVYAAVFVSYSLISSQDMMSVLNSNVKIAFDFINKGYPDLIKQTLVDTGMSEKELISSIAAKIPATVVVIMFVFLFVNLMIVARMDQRMTDFLKFDNLMGLRMPEQLVWPALVLGGLYLYSTTDYNSSLALEAVSEMLFKGIMMVYFFYGLMITYLITALKIPQGFLRALIFSLIIVFAYVFVAAVGFFDTWLNFRKYFNKKGEEA